MSFYAKQPSEKLRSSALTMHRHNPRAEQTDADRVYSGDGILNLGQMLSILEDAGYAGVISLELFNPNYWEQDPTEVARIGLEKMKSALPDS